MLPNLTDLAWGFPPRNVYVISDTEYTKLLQEKVLDEIRVLRSRRLVYQDYLEKLDREILELEKRAGHLEQGLNPSASLSRGFNDVVNKENSNEDQESER